MFDNNLSKAAKLLTDAWRRHETLDFPVNLLPKDRQEAYLVQDRMAEQICTNSNNKIRGWKVGATSPGVQSAEGYDGPIPGRLILSTFYLAPASIPASSVPHSKLEAEIAFRFKDDLDLNQHPYTAENLAELVVLHAAFDVTSTRYQPETRNGWTKMQNMLAGIADNGNGGAYVIGPAVEEWQGFDLMNLTVDLRITGNKPVSNLFGTFRGDPLDALVWTVNSVIDRGFGFEKGDYILTGSLTEPQDIQEGDHAVAHFPGIGEMTVQLIAKQ